MKRLFAYIGLTMLFTLTVVFYLEPVATLVIIALCLVSISVVLLVKKLKPYKFAVLIISIVAVFSCLYSSCYTFFVFNPKAEKYDDEAVCVTAEIIAEPTSSQDRYYYQLRTLTVNGKEENLKLTFNTSQQLLADYKDIITCDMRLSECDYPYYKSKGFTHRATPTEYIFDYDVERVEDKGIGYIPILIKDKLLFSIKSMVKGEESDLALGITLGDKEHISENLLDAFEKTGLTHIIVVSGMHMVVIARFISLLLQWLPKRRRYNLIRFSAIGIFILLFMAITGFTTSVIRAGITIMIMEGALIVRRQYDPLSALGFAAFIQLLNPYAVGDVGLLLSYSAVLGLIVLFPRLQGGFLEKIKYKEKFAVYKAKVKHSFIDRIKFYLLRFKVYGVELFLSSFSAVLFVTPITILAFGTMTPLSIIITAIISPVVDVVLIGALLLSVLYYIPVVSFLAYPLAALVKWLVSIIIYIVNFAKEIPFALVYIDADFFLAWFLSLAVVLILIFIFKRDKNLIKLTVAFSLVFFVLGNSIFPLFIRMNKTSVKVYPVGKGITLSVENGNVIDFLSCGGEGKYLDKITREIHTVTDDLNLLICPDVKSSQTGYADNFLQEFQVKSLFMYSDNLFKDAFENVEDSCENYYEYAKNETFELTLEGGLIDLVMNKKGNTYQYLYNNDIDILIIPENGDCKEIPENIRKVDIIVLCDKVENLDLIKYEQVVWSSNEELTENIGEVIKVENEPVEIYFREG